ncbi:MAG: ScyD/ScyE family protein [Nocardioidaceae bacterium]
MPARSRRFLLVLAGVALLCTSGGLTSIASADAEPWEVIAEGLDNPRQLTFAHHGAHHGALYVTEAGTGGDACTPGPMGQPACFGTTGAVTRLQHDQQRRVLTGLPSLGIFGGTEIVGPSDIAFNGMGNRFALLVGLGADPAVRAALPEAAGNLGSLLTGKVTRAGWEPFADIGDFELAENPDGGLPDSNPVGMIRDGGDYVVADAGGNALLEIEDDDIETLAVFPDQTSGGATFQAVPTSVAKGPDGAYYVSQLTGFPFVPGAANIWRVEEGEAPEVYAAGLTHVTDLAFHDGDLYAVQISDTGLQTGLDGSVVKVDTDGDHETVVDGLFAPYGIAFRKDHAYVTTCAVCTHTGQVLKVDLDD